jgi:hypothetical protein
MAPLLSAAQKKPFAVLSFNVTEVCAILQFYRFAFAKLVLFFKTEKAEKKKSCNFATNNWK